MLQWRATEEMISMSNIAQAFKKHKAFIPFITCGDPNLEFNEQALYTLIENGADIIELGIPFSDPVAEGAAIQAASARALKRQTNIEQIFALVKRIRTKSQIPIVFMTYANVVFSQGQDFLNKCEALGIDGLILPDVPYEERDLFAPSCKQKGIDFISLIAPTSHNRIEKIVQDAQGFIYCVSSLGVTGVRENIGDLVRTNVEQIKKTSDLPVTVGFGISTPEQAQQIAQYADGVIIGSAIVDLCAQGNIKNPKEVLAALGAYAKSIRNALDKN